jgi:hypothetical protein
MPEDKKLFARYVLVIYSEEIELNKKCSKLIIFTYLCHRLDFSSQVRKSLNNVRSHKRNTSLAS